MAKLKDLPRYTIINLAVIYVTREKSLSTFDKKNHKLFWSSGKSIFLKRMTPMSHNMIHWWCEAGYSGDWLQISHLYSARCFQREMIILSLESFF